MAKWQYGVILDAGSSGTRLHVYRWLKTSKARKEADSQALKSLPALKTKKDWTKKIHPGISTFADTIDLVGPDHLNKLFQHALSKIPSDEVPNTPIFLLATAGVRLLPDLKRKALLAEVCTYARTTTNFLLPDCGLHIQAISGDAEGLYGWIAANYLLGGFDTPQQHDHGKGHHTYGFLDMGGASAQIAFAPNATEAERHAEDLKLLRMRTLDGAVAEYKVFVTTWLRFGVREARRRYVETLLNSTLPIALLNGQVPDPCLPLGLEISTSGDVLFPGESTSTTGSDAHLYGTGKFDECLRATHPLLGKDAACEDAPCLLNGVHVPAIDFDVNHFVGVSEYWHTTHEVFEADHKEKAYDVATYQSRVEQFCTRDWIAIKAGLKAHTWGKKVDEAVAAEVCFKASWLINVLHEGIGIPRVGLETLSSSGGASNGTKDVLDATKERGFRNPFQAVDKIDDTEVSWTLGKMLLYASSQIPSSSSSTSSPSNTLPVGFGSNTPPSAGIPADFQYAGGSPYPHSTSTNTTHGVPPSPDDDLDTPGSSWTNGTLFSTATPRRIPGFLLFMLIVCIAVFFLAGKERRKRFYARFGPFRSSNSPRFDGRFGGLYTPVRRKAPGTISGLFGKKSGGGGGLFGSANNQGASERLLEGGLPAASDFELDEMASSPETASSRSSEGAASSSSRVESKTSGWATPRAPHQTPGLHGGAFDGEYFGHVSGGSGSSSESMSGLGLGLGGVSAMERGGLLSRTESREWLGEMGARKGKRGRGRGGKSLED